VQLGIFILQKEDDNYIKKILKDWDTRGKGEFLRGEFRMNLRNLGLQATPAECDDLFDSWDEDRGGSLDLKELKTALTGACQAAKIFNATPDPTLEKAKAMRRRAELSSEAASLSQQAEALEAELVSLTESIQSRADVRLGQLLSKRKIKPGAVVTQWSRSRGDHQGELSKAEFRTAVENLGISFPTTTADIDAVFDTFDEDGGGYMDTDEATAMIKGLQATADQAERDRRRKERETETVRARALKAAAAAAEALSDPQPIPPPSSEEGGKKRKKKAEDADDTGAAKTTPSVAVPAASPVTLGVEKALKMINDLFSSERGQKKKSAAEIKKAAQDLSVYAVGRMKHFFAARAFSSWVEFHQNKLWIMGKVDEIVKKLRNPSLNCGFRTWHDFARARKQSLRSMARTIARLMARRQIMAVESFQRNAAGIHEARRLRAISAKSFAKMAHPRLVEYFAAWRKELLLAKVERDAPPCVRLANCLRDLAGK